jgi:heme exporter protein C
LAWFERKGLLLSIAAVASLAVGAVMALVWSPPEAHMGQDVRLLYVHVPSIWTAYLALTVTLGASILFLWKQDLKWDDLASASAEIAVLLTALAIACGSIWGKLTWGTYWVWDPRLTTTAVLLVIFTGYLLLRALTDDPWLRARQSAVIAIIGFIDIPVVHFSVLWWRSLHQPPTFLRPDLANPTMDPRMELTLVFCTTAFTVMYAALLAYRLKLARLERQHEEIDWEVVSESDWDTEPEPEPMNMEPLGV